MGARPPPRVCLDRLFFCARLPPRRRAAGLPAAGACLVSVGGGAYSFRRLGARRWSAARSVIALLVAVCATRRLSQAQDDAAQIPVDRIT